ncbi:hypothetical protein [Acidovorax sp. SUPP2825]|uniref:hypothetical protein n=1 Tax=Acidovorax sp. SUPP2825 TaxID=2920879 RepID=UPI0023DE2445|nr:hypothetical protein [Acidovorax sp. SUPP2825]GKS93207.1 hypothetical protein AVAK2825_01750 [Acidovorax sp. SUPP2825]
MSMYAMTYRAADGRRVSLHLIAASLAAAWDRAFDVADRLHGDVRGFGVAKASA